MGVGEPWYTSGTQLWNGTAATLKPSPTSRSARPASIRPFSSSTLFVRKSWIAARLVVPVAP